MNDRIGAVSEGGPSLTIPFAVFTRLRSGDRAHSIRDGTQRSRCRQAREKLFTTKTPRHQENRKAKH